MNIYEQMANIIQTRGKSKGIMVDSSGSCCLIGAYALAKGYQLPIPEEGMGFGSQEDYNFTENLYSEFNRDPDFVNLALKIKSYDKDLRDYPAKSTVVYTFSDTHNQNEVVDFLKAL